MRAGWAVLREFVRLVISRSIFLKCFPFDNLTESYLSYLK